MFRRSPMTRLLSRRALRMILGLFVLIEAIFLTDVFTSELEAVIKNGGNALNLLFALSLRLPEVVDFALPIVLFLGLYLAINGARKDNELMICAAAGESWTRVPRLALIYGVTALLVSLLFSGVLTPLSSYVLRLSYYEMAASQLLRQLENPGDAVQVRSIADRIVIATPPEPPGAGRGGLFVFAADRSGNAWRVGKAQDWDVVPGDVGPGYTLRLEGFREYQGQVVLPDQAGSGAGDTEAAESLALLPRPPALAGGPPVLDQARIRVRRLQLDFRPADLVRARDDTQRLSERLLFQSGGPLEGVRTLPDGTRVTTPTRRFGELMARALLCLVTAAVAVAAAALSATRQGRYVGLPLGMLLVLAGDVTSRTLLGDAAIRGYGLFWPAALAMLAAGLGPTLAYVWLRGEHIVAPARIGT